MPPSETAPFAVRERGGVAVVLLVGDLDGRAESSLTAAWEAALDLRPQAVAIGFEHAGYINSTGIALIVGLLSKARARDLPLRAFGLNAHYREIFEITRLADYLEIHRDEAGATGHEDDGHAVEKGAVHD